MTVDDKQLKVKPMDKPGANQIVITKVPRKKGHHPPWLVEVKLDDDTTYSVYSFTLEAALKEMLMELDWGRTFVDS